MRSSRGKHTRGDAPTRPARDKALDLLARREYSRQELHARLLRDGYPRDAVDDALARLADAHYQDDGRFAEMLVRSRIRQGYGPLRLRAELKSHGLADGLIRDAVQAGVADADWPALARAQLQHRYGSQSAGDYAERARRAQYLLRRGFDGPTARAAAQAVSDREADGGSA